MLVLAAVPGQCGPAVPRIVIVCGRDGVASRATWGPNDLRGRSSFCRGGALPLRQSSKERISWMEWD
jgi:hypothetical protein